MDDQRIVVLIPAFNEAATIQSIVDRCLLYVTHVMVIDDGSTDDTKQVVQKTLATVLSNTVNLGKGATLLKGFQEAITQQYAGVISLDADGQHDPDDLHRFLAVIQCSPDALVIGARRRSTHNAPKFRLFANKIADFFISCAARKRLYDTQSGYRYYPISFLKQYLARPQTASRFAFEAEILIAAARSGLAVDYVDIQSCYPNDARASHYHPSKDTWKIVKAVGKMFFKK